MSAPEVFIEDDGEVAFDWDLDRAASLTASVNIATYLVSWAILVGEHKACGRFYIPADWPLDFKDALQRISRCELLAGRALGDRRPLAPPEEEVFEKPWSRLYEQGAALASEHAKHIDEPTAWLNSGWRIYREVMELLETKLAAGEARAAAPQRQLEQLTEKVTHQRGELANVNVVLRRKNVELAALHFVWCSGPCGETVTQAIVTEAIRNTDRLIEKFNGQRSNRAWKALHEYPDDQKALVSAWGDLRKETARAEAAEAAIVSLQAEFDAQQRELTDWKTDEKNISDAYLRVRALLGAYDTDFGGRNRFEVTERHIKELLKFREQLLTLQAQLQAITQEMREKADDCKQWSGIPCQSENSWHADTYNRWADALDGTGKDTRE